MMDINSKNQPDEQSHPPQVQGPSEGRIQTVQTHATSSLQAPNIILTLYKCIYCLDPDFIAFKEQHELHQHLKHNHGKHVCTICHKHLKSSDSLRFHLTVHLPRDQRGHKCTECPLSFGKSSNLKDHFRAVHLGKKPYKCTMCSNAYGWRELLREHVLKHKGEKPYKCETCDKRFASANSLRGHIRSVHENVKFACEDCSMEFNWPQQRRLHQKKVHALPDQHHQWMCIACNRSYESAYQLKQHTATHLED